MAFADNIGFFADIKRFAYIMVRDKNAKAPVFKMGDDRFDIADRNGVHPRKRLVKQYEPRICRNGSRYFDPAPFSTGQGHAQAFTDMRNMKFFQQEVEFGAALFAGKFFAGLEDGHYVVGHAEFSENRCFLWQVAQASPRPTVHGTQSAIVVSDGAPLLADQRG